MVDADELRHAEDGSPDGNSSANRGRAHRCLICARPGEFFGLWLSGKQHVFFLPREPARPAGNTLVWQENGTTYRLEAPGLTEREALDLAAALRDTP